MLTLPQNNLKKHHKYLKDKNLELKPHRYKSSKDSKSPKTVQFNLPNNNSKPVNQQNYDLDKLITEYVYNIKLTK